MSLQVEPSGAKTTSGSCNVQAHDQQQPCDRLAVGVTTNSKDPQQPEKTVNSGGEVAASDEQPKTQNHVILQQVDSPLDASRLLLQQAEASTSSGANNQHQQQQWLAQVAAQTQLGVKQRMSQAGDQLGHSLRQLYASASSIAAAAEHPPAYHNIPGVVPFYHGRSIGPPPSYDDVINPYAPPPAYQSLFGQMREARKSSRGILDLLRRLFIIIVSMLGCTILIVFMILIPFTMIIVGAVYIDECRIEHIPAFLLVGGLVWASKNIIHCYAQCRQMPPTSSSSSSSSMSDGGDILADGNNNSSPNSSLAGLESPESSQAPSLNGHEETLAASGGLESDLQLASSGGRHHHSTTSHRHRRATMRRSTRRNNSNNNYYNQHSSSRLKSSICESLLNCVLFGWFIAGCVIVFRNYEPDFEDSTSLRYCHRTVYMYTFWLISSAVLLLCLFIGCVCCLMVSSAIATRQDDIDLV